jgi:Mitochondrial ribosomal protein L28
MTQPPSAPPPAACGTAAARIGAPATIAARSFSDKPAKKVQKAKKKKAPQGKAGDSSGRSKELELVLASLDAPSRAEGPISDEERERRVQVGRNYVIGRFRQHNEMDHDLTCKMHLKRHALNMLKRHTRLNEEALKIDDDQAAPLWRRMPVWTPPIPGFDPSKFLDRDDK